MDRLNVIYAYYDNRDMLKTHLAEWRKYPDDIAITVIDDGSPRWHAVDALRDSGLNLRLYRIKENIPWNQNGARNLGMEVCASPWALLLDMDHLLPVEDAVMALEMDKDPAAYYVPRRVWPDGSEYKRHPNSWLLRREKFFECGGYDEDFCGHYGSDMIFRMALDTVARRCESDMFKTVHYEGVIADANTTEYGRKGTKYHSVKNPALMKKRRAAPYKAVNPLRFTWERLL